MYVPWTGLGMYGGFRGNRWLKNRIKVFKQFVIPSLQAQTNKNFTLWCSWRREEKRNPYVKELIEYLNKIREFETVHTFHGVCFWDDKYPDDVARERLITSLHESLPELLDVVGGKDVLMTLQPSDDCYHFCAVEIIQSAFKHKDLHDIQALGFEKGHMINYLTKEIAEYNPTTNPPFFTIKFSRETFVDPLKHMTYTGPYKSHEYIGEKLKYRVIKERGFLVGTHGENISTVFNHPFKGEVVSRETLKDYGIYDVPPLKINLSWRKWILRKLPHRVQRKLRYYIGELFWNEMYNFLRE